MPPRKGLYSKYVVYRVENGMVMGEPLDGCFVLRPRTDDVAAEALAAYALATPDEQLRDDLFEWLWEIRNVPEG